MKLVEPNYTEQELVKQQIRFYVLINGTLTSLLLIGIPALLYWLVA